MEISSIPLSKIKLHPLYERFMPDSAFEFTNAEQFSSGYVLPVVVQSGRNYHVIANYRSFLIKTYADISNKKSEGKTNIDVLLVKESDDRISVSVVTDILSSSLKYRHQSVTDVAGVVDKLIEDRETYTSFCHLLNYESYTSFIKTALDRDYQSYVKHMKNKAPRRHVEYQKILIARDMLGVTEEIAYEKIKKREYLHLLLFGQISESHVIEKDGAVVISGVKCHYCQIDNYNFLSNNLLLQSCSYYLPSIHKILYLVKKRKAILQDVVENAINLKKQRVEFRDTKNNVLYFNYNGKEYSSMKRTRLLLPDYAYNFMRESGIDI